MDCTVITWYTSSLCAQRSPRIAVEDKTQLQWSTSVSSKKNKTAVETGGNVEDIPSGYAPSLKGIWPHRGLKSHNWCRDCNCTEKKRQTKDKTIKTLQQQTLEKEKALGQKTGHLVRLRTDAAPELTWTQNREVTADPRQHWPSRRDINRIMFTPPLWTE